jgi:hypothetical protein
MVITPASTPAAPQRENDEAAAAEMASRIASGPGFWTGWLAELDRQGLLEDLLADDVIARALREAPWAHRYDRVLTAKMTVICVLVACLFPGAGYDTVLATAFGLPGLRSVPGAEVPSGSAFSQARKLLGEQVSSAVSSSTTIAAGSPKRARMNRCSATSAAVQSQACSASSACIRRGVACPDRSASCQHDLRSPGSASSAPIYANAASRDLACANTGASRPRSSP